MACQCARRYSAALCRGLIEANRAGSPMRWTRFGIPRLYAAASLKQHDPLGDRQGGFDGYSAALCRGLIEAAVTVACEALLSCVFRGFMPRPH